MHVTAAICLCASAVRLAHSLLLYGERVPAGIDLPSGLRECTAGLESDTGCVAVMEAYLLTCARVCLTARVVLTFRAAGDCSALRQRLHGIFFF